MFQAVSFVLNLPWTVLGILTAICSLPRSIRLSRKPLAIIFYVKSFWWHNWRPSRKGSRALVVGHAVLLSPAVLEKDLEHELVHVEQYERKPIIQPLLYAYQTRKYGYRQNKYEREAYEKSGSPYLEK